MTTELLLSGVLAGSIEPARSGYRFLSKSPGPTKSSKMQRIFQEARRFDAFVTQNDLGIQFLSELPSYDFLQRVTIGTVFKSAQIEQMQKFLKINSCDQFEQILNDYPTYQRIRTALQEEMFQALLPEPKCAYDDSNGETLRQYLQRRQNNVEKAREQQRQAEQLKRHKNGEIAAARLIALERTAEQFHGAILKSIFARKRTFSTQQHNGQLKRNAETMNDLENNTKLLHAKLLKRIEHQKKVFDMQGVAMNAQDKQLFEKLDLYRLQCAAQLETLQRVRQSQGEYAQRREDLQNILLDIEAEFQQKDLLVNLHKSDIQTLNESIHVDDYAEFHGPRATVSFKKHERTEDVTQCLRNWDDEGWD